jgi:drug/metabolite transporter (DMT)-like permease
MMDTRVLGIALVIASVTILSVAQFTIKSRLNVFGPVPFSPGELLPYVARAAIDLQMWLGVIALILASVCWYLAISRIPLSIAYPIGALAYPIIYVGSLLFLREQFSLSALLGNGLIVLGVFIATGLAG